MTEPLAIVTGKDGYRGLIRAFSHRREQLGIATGDMDDIARITEGHTSKLLRRDYIKVLGPVTLGAIMQALAVKLVIAEDDEALSWLMRQSSFSRRDEKRVRTRKQATGSKHSGRWLISKKTSAQMNALRHLKLDDKTRARIASLGGKARAKKLSRKDRKRIARKAACDRWHRMPRRAKVASAASRT